MNASPSPVFLLTDFGSSDPYVGLMKAVLQADPPYPPVVDLTHHVPPQDETCAAFLTEYCLPHLPETSVVLVVVDPEVGTDRDILAVQTEPGPRLVAPDTGILEGLCWDRAHHVKNPRFRRDTRASTFHGRDWFAPVGRFLSRGGDLSALGEALDRSPRGSMVPEPTRMDGAVRGEVLYVDHFGNLITNLRPDHLPEPPVEFEVADRRVRGLHEHYGTEVELIAVVGSFNRVEISSPRGSARNDLGVGRGEKITAYPG